MYLLAVLSLHYCAWASHHSGLSCCRTQASCSAARGIFLDQGSNPRSLQQQADSQPLDHQAGPRGKRLHGPVFCWVYFRMGLLGLMRTLLIISEYTS